MKRKLPSDWEVQPNSSRFLVSSPVGSNEIVVGRTRLIEGIDRVLTTSDLTKKTQTTGVRALGIHGASGMGKTTLAKILCEFYHQEYDGRVCLLELGSMTLLNLLKKVLQELSVQQDKGTLSGIVDAVQAWNALEDGMKVYNKVFLVIDNIWSDQSFVAERFMKMRFARGSRLVLITRDAQVLLRNIRLPITCCEAMPDLTEQEAMELFIQTGNCEMKDEQDEIAVRKWVSRCHHRSYHPLSIKVLADATTVAMGRRPSEWTDGILDFKQVTEIPRLGYESLPPTYRPAFVSLLLFAPSKDFVSVKPSVSVHSMKSICRWLAIVHNMDESRALTFLHGMKAKNVLEPWQDMSDHLRIHDSFKEFAERELQQGRFKSTHLLWNQDRNIPHELKTSPSQKPSFCEIKVLKLVNCVEVKTLDLGYMTELRYLVVEGCWKLESIHGLKKLRNLVWLQCNKCLDIDMPLLSDIQVLRLEGSTEAPNVTGFQGMKELALVKAPQLERAPELSRLTALEILILNGCSKLKDVPDLSVLSSCLRSLHLSECTSLESIPGLERLKALRHLGLSKCSSLQRIPSLQRLKKLKFLDLSATAIREAPGIHALRELVELHVTSLSKFPDVLGLRKLRKIFWRGCLVGRDGVMLSESKALALGDESDDDENSSDSDDSPSGDEEEAACDDPSDDTDEDEEEGLHSQDDEEIEEDPSAKEEDDDDYDGSAEEPEENSAESSSDGDSE